MNEATSDNISGKTVVSYNTTEQDRRDPNVYEWRMDAAEEAKKKSIVPHFGFFPEDAVIVDAGSGTGKMAESIAKDLHVKVIGLDLSHDLMETATQNQALVYIKFGDAAEQNFPDNSIDIKYFSTSGHEVESFGGKGRMTTAVKNTFKELKPGGKIIIRDFAKPESTDPIFMQILASDGVDNPDEASVDGELDYNKLSTRALFDRFYQEFLGGIAFEYEEVEIDGNKYIRLAPEWAHEFYLRKDYTGNWRSEIKEKYTYWTEKEAEQVLQEAGYVDIKVVADPNEWILTNRLRGKIALFEKDDQGKLRQIEFPDTHMVVVGEKPDTGEDKSKEEIKTVDYEKLLESIEYGQDDYEVIIGNTTFKVSTDKKPLKGSKKVVYFLDGNVKKVLKVVRSDGYSPHNMFKAIYQSIEREGLLDEKQIPHMRILEKDPDGPPYRYFVQEQIPEGSISAADLIRNGNLTEEDIKQMASYINAFEKEKEWQLDTNPFNWYRVNNEDGTTTMTYIDGKIYRYEDDWEFRKVGLLQWIDPIYIEGEETHSAKIPRKQAYDALRIGWTDNQHQQVLWWKKYLNPLLQPNPGMN